MATFQGADFQSESVFWLGVESPVKEMLLKLHKSSESQILETTELRQMFSDFVSERDASIRVVMDKVADSYSCINTKVDKRHISSLKGELFQVKRLQRNSSSTQFLSHHLSKVTICAVGYSGLSVDDCCGEAERSHHESQRLTERLKIQSFKINGTTGTSQYSDTTCLKCLLFVFLPLWMTVVFPQSCLNLIKTVWKISLFLADAFFSDTLLFSCQYTIHNRILIILLLSSVFMLWSNNITSGSINKRFLFCLYTTFCCV